MSSQTESLIELITDLVLGELAGQAVEPKPVPSPTAICPASGAKVLVVPGPGTVEADLWESLASHADISPSVLVWNSFRQDELPAICSAWALEARTRDWVDVLSSYDGLCLLGADLSVLGGLANLGASGAPPSSLAVAALSRGIPIFVDNHHYEFLRRHSSRLASGFVGRFEELYRIAASFGLEFGGRAKLDPYLSRISVAQSSMTRVVETRSGGRDVVTVEDVEVLREDGETRLAVAMGTIVTPLAAQRASEWGIEVVFQ